MRRIALKTISLLLAFSTGCNHNTTVDYSATTTDFDLMEEADDDDDENQESTDVKDEQ